MSQCKGHSTIQCLPSRATTQTPVSKKGLASVEPRCAQVHLVRYTCEAPEAAILTPFDSQTFSLTVLSPCFSPIQVRLFGYNARTAASVGIALAQIGEFSFILLSRAQALKLVGHKLYLLLMGTTALSLVLTPFAFKILPYLSSPADRYRYGSKKGTPMNTGAGGAGGSETKSAGTGGLGGTTVNHHLHGAVNVGALGGASPGTLSSAAAIGMISGGNHGGKTASYLPVVNAEQAALLLGDDTGIELSSVVVSGSALTHRVPALGVQAAADGREHSSLRPRNSVRGGGGMTGTAVGGAAAPSDAGGGRVGETFFFDREREGSSPSSPGRSGSADSNQESRHALLLAGGQAGVQSSRADAVSETAHMRPGQVDGSVEGVLGESGWTSPRGPGTSYLVRSPPRSGPGGVRVGPAPVSPRGNKSKIVSPIVGSMASKEDKGHDREKEKVKEAKDVGATNSFLPAFFAPWNARANTTVKKKRDSHMS